MSIENKIKTNDKIFIAKCKQCEVEVPFYYIGSMGKEIGKEIHLYNCPKCNGTYSKKSIIKYNNEINKSD